MSSLALWRIRWARQTDYGDVGMNFGRRVAITSLFALTAVGLYAQGSSSPIRERSLPLSLRFAARKLGQRLLTPGKERSVIIGAIVHGTGAPARVQIAHEVPGRIRIDEQSRPSLGISDSGPWKSGAALTPEDTDLLETFLNDSQEEFLVAQAKGMPTRYLGAGFRADDGRATNYKGPFYDLHQTFPSVMPGRANNGAPKTYFLNSETAFLEQVRYRLTRAGRTTEVFVRISNWQRFGGEWMPTVIERFENGSPVVTLSVNAVAFSPKTNDGLFDRR